MKSNPGMECKNECIFPGLFGIIAHKHGKVKEVTQRNK